MINMDVRLDLAMHHRLGQTGQPEVYSVVPKRDIIMQWLIERGAREISIAHDTAGWVAAIETPNGPVSSKYQPTEALAWCRLVLKV